MKFPILEKNFDTDYEKMDIKTSVENLNNHSKELNKFSKIDSEENRQKVSAETLYIAQECIQILKYLQDKGYNVDIDFQIHNYNLRNYKKAGTVDLKFNLGM